MSETETNLRSLFDSAEQLRTQLDALQATSNQYRTSLQDAISSYEKCRELATRASLFSPNETLEDISTGDLKYLAIDFHLADLSARGFLDNRAQQLRKSREIYTNYLSRLDDYSLLLKDEKRLFERYLENKDEFSLLSSNDPTARRNAKLARFQEEKDLKQRIQHLHADPRMQQDDDALVRRLLMAEISFYTHQTFQALDMITQELKILSLAPPAQAASESARKDPRETKRGTRENYTEGLDMELSSMLQNSNTGPLLSKSGRPLQPFTLLDSRERLRNGVFRPGHNLPTMTIDEYLEEERRRGGIIEGGGEPPVVEPNEDDFDAADSQTMKAREWDEFVEANPKGNGNTLNRG